MRFETQIYTPLEYKLLDAWGTARNFPTPDEKFLPRNGLLVLCDGKPVVMGFLFSTDANVAAIAHIMSDPESLKNVRREALDWLMDVLCMRALQLGFTQVNCSTNIPALGVKFEEFGFQKVDENVSHFRRFLCPLQD